MVPLLCVKKKWKKKMMWTWKICGLFFINSSSEGINKSFIILLLLQPIIYLMSGEPLVGNKIIFEQAGFYARIRPTFCLHWMRAPSTPGIINYYLSLRHSEKRKAEIKWSREESTNRCPQWLYVCMQPGTPQHRMCSTLNEQLHQNTSDETE